MMLDFLSSQTSREPTHKELIEGKHYNPKPYLIKCITKSRQQQDILYQNYKEIRCDQHSTKKSSSRKIYWPSGKMGSWKSFHIHHQVKPAQKTSQKTIRWGMLDKSCTRNICVHSCMWWRGWNHQLKVWTRCTSKEGRDHIKDLRCETAANHLSKWVTEKIKVTQTFCSNQTFLMTQLNLLFEKQNSCYKHQNNIVQLV